MIVPIICSHCEVAFKARLDVYIGQPVSPFHTWHVTCPDCGYSFPIMIRIADDEIGIYTSKVTVAEDIEWEIGYRTAE